MNLFEYLQERMSMSHIYQPVMIRTLLRKGGRAHKDEIAQEILSYDRSQIEYYAIRVNNMVGRVLRKNKVVLKEKDDYQLLDFNRYSAEELTELERLCTEKISSFLAKRDSIFEHRNHSRKAISGSIRYDVLKRAKNRCELCGIPAEQRALEVDHIVPKSLGGEDAIHNYQALCYKCNANKGNRDQTDFRAIGKRYELRQENCLFCKQESFSPIAENNLAFAIYDAYPVSEGHCLIIPKRHSKDWFELDQAELNALNDLSQKMRTKLLEKDRSISGFNIGANAGESAGQTIFHTHVHLIPRRDGDVENPRGGVRHSVMGRGFY